MMHVCVCVCAHKDVCVCMCACMYVRTYVCMYSCMRMHVVSVGMYACLHVLKCVRMYASGGDRHAGLTPRLEFVTWAMRGGLRSLVRGVPESVQHGTHEGVEEGEEGLRVHPHFRRVDPFGNGGLSLLRGQCGGPCVNWSEEARRASSTGPMRVWRKGRRG